MANLRPFYQVWAEIILGSLHHRKKMFSPSAYISPDHKYTLFCIGRKIELNISHILFENMKTSGFLVSAGDIFLKKSNLWMSWRKQELLLQWKLTLAGRLWSGDLNILFCS